ALQGRAPTVRLGGSPEVSGGRRPASGGADGPAPLEASAGPATPVAAQAPTLDPTADCRNRRRFAWCAMRYTPAGNLSNEIDYIARISHIDRDALSAKRGTRQTRLRRFSCSVRRAFRLHQLASGPSFLRFRCADNLHGVQLRNSASSFFAKRQRHRAPDFRSGALDPRRDFDGRRTRCYAVPKGTSVCPP